MIKISILRFTFSLFLSLLSVQLWAFQSIQLVKDARSQIGRTLYYDPAYTALNIQWVMCH